MYVGTQTPDPQRIDRSTQTEPDKIGDVFKFLTYPVKSIACHNFIWDVDEPATRDEIINNRPTVMAVAMCGTSCVSAICCAVGGLLMSHSCSHIAAEVMAGGITGCQIGHMGEKVAHEESIRIEGYNVVTSQPQRNSNQTDSVLPPSYEQSQLDYSLRQRGRPTGETRLSSF